MSQPYCSVRSHYEWNSQNTSPRAGLVRSNIAVASCTALSRLTGLIRIVVFGIVIGQTALADAYDGANNSPNSIYELLVGGLLAASLVPLFTRFAEDKDEEATEAVGVYFSPRACPRNSCGHPCCTTYLSTLFASPQLPR